MDEHLESRLREELHRTVDQLQVSAGLWQRIRRRHRREPRQRLLAVATSMALLVVVAVAALPVVRGLAQQPADDDRIRIVETPPPLELPDTAPVSWWDPGFRDDPPPTGPPVVLAQGSSDGQDWTFVAYAAGVDRDAPCYGFFETRELTPGPGRCREPADVSPARLYPAEGPAGIVYGFARKDAARVKVVLDDGRSFDAPLLPDREDLPFRFYLGSSEGIELTGDMIRETIVYDGSGERLAAVGGQESPLGSGFDPASGPVRSVASGEIDGERWELLAHPTLDGLCFAFSQEPPNTVYGGGTCEIGDTPSNGAVSVSIDGGRNTPTFVYGVVVKEAALVRVQLPGVGVEEVRPTGRNAGFKLNFYVLALPPNARADAAQVTAVDASGQVIPSGGGPAPTTTPVPTTTTPVPTTTMPPTTAPRAELTTTTDPRG